MKQQLVHKVSYFCKREFNFDTTEKELIVIPKGAEVISVNLEIVTKQESATCSIGLNGAEAKFMSNVNCNSNTCFKESETKYTALKNETINAKINNVGNGKAVLRVLYFLPSTSEVSYN